MLLTTKFQRGLRCIIQVRIKNQGEEAYMPSRFGKSSTVERRMNKDGSGGYKIKDHSKKIVDTTKLALTTIREPRPTFRARFKFL